VTGRHLHQCACGRSFECQGDLERNHDGHPEVICRLFHVAHLDQCEDCWVGEQHELSDEQAAEALSAAAAKAMEGKRG
jgi:hypothetical protein